VFSRLLRVLAWLSQSGPPLDGNTTYDVPENSSQVNRPNGIEVIVVVSVVVADVVFVVEAVDETDVVAEECLVDVIELVWVVSSHSVLPWR
jgi:hypothetical protein